jgi:Lactonase, 7-bladed beta-propeller
MKLKKFGKALLTGVLSAGVVFGVSSCVQSYTVGYMYVTGTVTAQPNGNGIISGYKIDHNTGELYPINTLPVSSGGANPVRAVLVDGSEFLYVLNRGLNAAGNGDCFGTGVNKCLNPSITQFAVGGDGSLTFQETFYTQGLNPFRLIADTSGSYLLVLDHDAPSSAACAAALGTGVTACADVTVFQINSTTGRLSLVQNAAVSAAGTPLSYFPVPANPVDFVMSSSFLLTLTSNTVATSFPYTGGSNVFPYSYASTTGQLTLSQNSAQPLGIGQGTAIINASSNIYVLDNEATTYTNSNGQTVPTLSQILPFTVGANGALQAQTGGIIPDDPDLSNPIQLLVESKGKFLYVANQGSNIVGPNPQSGIAGYFITTSPAFQLTFIAGEPFGSGSGPQCIVEDPSDQFIYTANMYDSSVTGRILDPNAGVLNPLRVSSSYPLQGPATWCLIDGRTS